MSTKRTLKTTLDLTGINTVHELLAKYDEIGILDKNAQEETMNENMIQIELIVCEGGDSGTWWTVVVDIPEDTPESKFHDVAVAELELDGLVIAYTGIYNVWEE